MTWRRALSIILCTLLLGATLAGAKAQAPMSEEAATALRQGQLAASRAMSSYDSHHPDQPLWRDAIRYGREARNLAPDRLEPLRFLAQVYVTTGWHARAWEAWMSYRELGGELDAQARRQLAAAGAWLGYHYYSAGELDRAVEYYETAYELTPGDGELASWLGRIMFDQGRPGDALPYWETAVEALPDQPLYRHYLERTRHQLRVGVDASNAFHRGMDAYQRGQLQEALAAFREATQANPNFTDAFEHAGEIALELGRPGDAINFWEQVLALEPDHARAQSALTLAEDQLQYGPQAVTAFRRGVERFEVGDVQAAADLFAQATEVNADYAEAWAWRGRIEFEAERYEQALNFYRRAAQLAPADDTYAFYERESARLAAPEPPAVVEEPAPEEPAVAEEPPEEPAVVEMPPLDPEPPAEPAPPVAEAPAEEPEPTPAPDPTDGGGMVLLDVNHTHPLNSPVETSAFTFFNSPANIEGDLTAPVNYAGGTLRQRVEVISKPSDLPVRYQICLVPTNIALRPACSDETQLTFTEPGIYEANQALSTFSNAGPIDWRQGILNVMLIVKDGEGNPIDGSFPLVENWHGTPDLSLYYPMQVRYSAVIIPPGGEFTGWP